MGFPGSSAGKESVCNAGDPGSIPGLRRSPGEGNGNTLQYSFLENPMDRGAWPATVHGFTRVGHNLATKPHPHVVVCISSSFLFITKQDSIIWIYHILLIHSSIMETWDFFHSLAIMNNAAMNIPVQVSVFNSLANIPGSIIGFLNLMITLCLKF